MQRATPRPFPRPHPWSSTSPRRVHRCSTPWRRPTTPLRPSRGRPRQVPPSRTVLGTALVGTDGHFTFTPTTALADGNNVLTATIVDAAGNVGSSTSHVVLTIDANGLGNAAPQAVSDAISTVTHASALTGNVLDNDTDPNAGDVLHVTSVRFANGLTVEVPKSGTATVISDHGTLQISADGHYSYQAIGANNVGNGVQAPTEAFTYTVSDGQGLSSSAVLGVSLQGVAPAAVATFSFAFVDAHVTLAGEALVLTDPNGVCHDISGIGTLHFTDGTIQENDGHSLVDDVWYLSNNLDVWKAHVDADTHYETFGWHEGRDPNAYFHTREYLAENPDVAAAGVNPLEHYFNYGEREGRSPGSDFAPETYLSLNPDVKAAGANALEHYLQHGQREGRSVYEGESKNSLVGDFDAQFYLGHNPDVAAAARVVTGVQPWDFAFQHYLDYGAKEGRAPNELFDPAAYLAANPDVAANGSNPLIHYQEYGWHEGRDPGPGFHTNAYLEANPDVAAAGMDPLQHFLEFGMKEGRLPV
ncbi:Ig-like domain-containing protein [Methylobacterium sp. Leaf125]|uniref:Ig-like domain-containing protein n=1 Tax=Methylobacterium sp. Leaf125 TaxID=1736265 RepID=UPI001FCDE286|nr:Ig-like domain-containing protein [Methylobacterium sp. Leaf125]